MKILGYCTECRRIKQVRVNLGRWTGRGTPQGICDSCQQGEDKKRQERREIKR